jgi:two-component system sensor histidine kinase DesK
MRISRDLHDVLGHTLSVIVVKAEAIRRLVPVDPEAAARHAGEVEEIGREALTDIRRAVHGYRSARVLDEIERARIAVDAAGITLDVQGADLLAELPAEQSVVLGWVVREAVTNVVRHSRARRCVIAVARTSDTVLLTVSDDGLGRAAVSDGRGEGLRGLRERVDAVGGDIRETGGTAGRDRSDGSEGFGLVVSLPLGRAAATVSARRVGNRRVGSVGATR